jgi:hypothetical protein
MQYPTSETPEQREAREVREHFEACAPLRRAEHQLAKELYGAYYLEQIEAEQELEEHRSHERLYGRP